MTKYRTLSPLINLKIVVGIALLSTKAADAQVVKFPNRVNVSDTLHLDATLEYETNILCYEVVVIKEKVQSATFKGGDKALNDFIYKHLKYPERALDAEISGDVAVNVTIGKDGSVIESQVIQRVGFDLDEEALRLVSLLPKFKPGKVNGKIGVTNKTIIIHFELPQIAPTEENKKE